MKTLLLFAMVWGIFGFGVCLACMNPSNRFALRVLILAPLILMVEPIREWHLRQRENDNW